MSMQSRMDWRSIRFDWNHARAFLVTAQEGSFSAAARALGTTQPTVGRQVDALETELGVALFERVGRRLELTKSGLELLEHVREMGEAASRTSLSATGRSQRIEGTITITASEVYSTSLLPRIITKLRQQHPGIEVEIVASNTRTDLQRREADIALRNYDSTQPDVIVRKVLEDSARLYATPDYISSIGSPKTVEGLADATFIGFNNDNIMAKGLISLGFPISHANFRITSDSHLVQWAMAKAGAGISVVTETMGETEPLVRRVLPDLAPITFPLWLATHRELHTSKRVRTVFDFLADELSR